MTSSQFFSSAYREPEEYDLDDPSISHSALLPSQKQTSHVSTSSFHPRNLLSSQRRQGGRYQNLPDVNNSDSDDAASDDSDVPASLIIEAGRGPDPRSSRSSRFDLDTIDSPPRNTSARVSKQSNRRAVFTGKMSTEERTMWKWANVENLDDFLARVYSYYIGKGIYTILLSRFLNLLTLAFVIIFSTFLVGCLDISEISRHRALSEIIVPQCIESFSPIMKVFLVTFIVFWSWQALRFVVDIPQLREIYYFYTYLLKIPDVDMQTISWQEVIRRIIMIRENNLAISDATSNNIRLNAHDIANRIMRKENYLIALFNKDLLNTKIFLPVPGIWGKQMVTKTLEWSLAFCILGFVFDVHGQVRKRFTRDFNKRKLASELKRRFIFMGFLNAFCAPFILVYLLVMYFFRYFEQYHKNPATLGSRGYSPYARWKFREFNELPHLFQKRLNSSYAHAMKYIDQFPKEKTVLFLHFVAFVAGSFLAVLALATIADGDLLLNLEISHDRTVLFYIGIFTTILAVSRGMIPDENLVFEPETMLRNVIEHTHYLPAEWNGKLHTDEIRRAFCQLFDYKLVLFLEEILSVIFTPFILWFSLPGCSEEVIDFFREFTVHVDGVGYVCSFAVFDFRKHGNTKYGAPVSEDGRGSIDPYYLSKEGKMEKSFLNFKVNHPEWEPSDLTASLYLNKMAQFNNQQMQHQYTTKSLRPNRTLSLDSAMPSSIIQHTQSHHRVNQHVNFEPAQIEATSLPSDSSTPSDTTTPNNIHSYQNSLDDEELYSHHQDAAEGFPSDLGESFVTAEPRIAQEHNDALSNSDEIVSGAGVFGLLNQLYELNNRTL